MTTISKETVISALRKFVAQRPGLEFGNYGNVKAYRAELRQITKDRHHAEKLLSAVAWRDSITAEQIIEAAKHAYSGRLSLEPTDDGAVRIDYCTGQYFPTEYRRAVCAVLSSVLWDYWRDGMPKPFTPPLCTGEWYPQRDKRGLIVPVSAGKYLRTKAMQEFGRSIASRWFN